MNTTPEPEQEPFAGPKDGIGYPLEPPTSTSDAGTDLGPVPGPAELTPPATVNPVLVPTPLPPQRALSRSQIMALTPLLATIAFFVCGFAFGGWAWSWLFWLAIPVVAILTGEDGKDGKDRKHH